LDGATVDATTSSTTPASVSQLSRLRRPDRRVRAGGVATLIGRAGSFLHGGISRAVTPIRRVSDRLAGWRGIPLVGGLLALALASIGESIVRARNTTPISLYLYLAAIALFAVTAWFLPPSRDDLPDAALRNDSSPTHSRQRRLAVLIGGALLAIVLSAIAFGILRQNLKALDGGWLWLISLIVLIATGAALRRSEGWPARWAVTVWPTGKRARWLVIAAIAGVIALGSAARLIGLDQVPMGINADEGDRAAVSISYLRGAISPSIFDSGWYYISMLYFTMLAQFFALSGIGFVQARVFTALFSIATLGAIITLGIRNFGLRVGLLAGAVLATMGISLQFARETSEAGPTATLWTLSMLLFFEGARRGKSWAWIGAGLTGGLSIYFYPMGRLWAVLAVLYGLYLLVHGLGGRRADILRGLTLAAVASALTVLPFIANVLNKPSELAQRFVQTSAFMNNNASRLVYYKPTMTTEELFAEQVIHSVGIFNQFKEGGGFWPTSLPILLPPLALLLLLGLGWASLRWRDARVAGLTLWFWVGTAGMILTVETPNVQRMATAVPVIALLIALVLDSLARRGEVLIPPAPSLALRALRWTPTAAVTLVVIWLVLAEGRFYFVDYAAMDQWMYPTAQGNSVKDQGPNTLVTTIGRYFHNINSGWIRLLAPGVPRGGIQSPGSNLPLTLPAERNLAIMLPPAQDFYLSYLRQVYPAGVTLPITHSREGLLFTIFRVESDQLAEMQGALATPPQGAPQGVSALGESPAGWTVFPTTMRWTAGLRAPRYWNYSFQIGPGPAKLTIDGLEVLSMAASTPVMSATVALARGDHTVVYEGTLSAQDQPALFQWASVPEPQMNQPPRALEWQMPRKEELIAQQVQPIGLYGVVQIVGRPVQLRLDRTLATCCLSRQVRSDGLAYVATWTGALNAPTAGQYGMSLLAQGAVDLKLDGESLIRADTPSDEPRTATVNLSAGIHAVDLTFRVSGGSGGLEWTWTPPGGVRSIVPPNALTPPARASIAPAVPFSELGALEFQPIDPVLETVR
jgi:4-amino-4-deoxy-L-arabinose transferase-like glycosyltransferase